MAVAGMDLGQGVERTKPGFPRLAQADQDAASVGHSGPARGLQGAQATPDRFLRRDGAIERVVDVLEHEAHRGVHVGQPLEVVLRHGPDVGVGQEPGRQRPFAGVPHQLHEPTETPSGDLGPQMRQGIGGLARQEQDLRGPALPCVGQQRLEPRLGHQPLPIPPIPAIGAIPRTVPGERDRQ